jgi:integral membrane sensor domain MASE1
MADQTSVKDGHPHRHSSANGAPEQQVVGGITGFGSDIATLAELQAELAVADLKEALQKAVVPLALIVVGVICVIGALPVALLGVAGLLAAALKIGVAWATLMTGGVVLGVALVVVAVSASKIGPSFSSFRRSREELARNLAWIRTVLLYSGRNPPRRVR